MTTNEYIQFIMQVKKETPLPPQKINEAAANEVAQLISGSFTHTLYEALWTNFFDIDTITQHLENLYDSNNHFGLVYIIFILANAVECSIPAQYTEISANDELVPTLSAAIIEDWLEYSVSIEPVEDIE